MHACFFSPKSSEESPTKDKPGADAEVSPIKKTTKKNARKVLDDSDDEADKSVNNDSKETENDQKHVNGGGTENTQNSDNNDVKKNTEVTRTDSPKLSSPSTSSDGIPRRKTGMFSVVHFVQSENLV